jgi:hypothetical protein
MGAIRYANEYCGKMGRQAVVNSIQPGTDIEYAKVFFQCQ